ncbi:hypothetical protein AB0L82_41010 [Nocardia sp. NPDC052001]|uniref:hypothetical protein n=1 Tax=Nocardia sp. NPDC052001 TaxID=3154853 RepID=UPI00342E9475
MRELHPDVRAGLAMKRELRHRIDEMQERAAEIVARRPSPSGLVIPEVDTRGRLRDLYLAPGTCDRFDTHELIAELMTAIVESTADAKRKYHLTMNDPALLPRPLAEVMGEWRVNGSGGFQDPQFGKTKE